MTNEGRTLDDARARYAIAHSASSGLYGQGT